MINQFISIVFDCDEAPAEAFPQRELAAIYWSDFSPEKKEYPELSRITKYWLWIYVNY